MSDGFLGRWSRRKQEVREGKALVEPTAPATPLSPVSPQPLAASGAAVAGPLAGPVAGPVAGEAPPQAAPDAPPALTLQDTLTLTPESDFKPFMAQGVSAEVKNAAVKKLFADPHFNVMDRLDIYIDDYSKPDPLPLAMLRQMTSAKFLNLFDEEPQTPVPGVAQAAPDGTPDSAAEAAPDHPVPESGTGDDAHSPPAQGVAQSELAAETPSLPPPTLTPAEFQPAASLPRYDHLNLRLQPDNAPLGQGPGGGAA